MCVGREQLHEQLVFRLCEGRRGAIPHLPKCGITPGGAEQAVEEVLHVPQKGMAGGAGTGWRVTHVASLWCRRHQVKTAEQFEVFGHRLGGQRRRGGERVRRSARLRVDGTQQTQTIAISQSPANGNNQIHDEPLSYAPAQRRQVCAAHHEKQY